MPQPTLPHKQMSVICAIKWHRSNSVCCLHALLWYHFCYCCLYGCGKTTFDHVIVIKVAKGGSPPLHLFPRACNPTTEANRANEADVAYYFDKAEVIGATEATKANKVDVDDKPNEANEAKAGEANKAEANETNDVAGKPNNNKANKPRPMKLTRPRPMKLTRQLWPMKITRPLWPTRLLWLIRPLV
jgi:hypothetical protein